VIDPATLAAIRRFWSKGTVTQNYEKILNAYMLRLDKVTVITTKATDGSQAGAQVVVMARDYQEWMATLEARLKEIERAEAGLPPLDQTGIETIDFSRRILT
jgi:hypothetical protein